MAIKRIAPLGVLDKIDKHITHPLGLESRQSHFYPTQASCYDYDGQLHGACLRQVVLSFWHIPESNPPSADTMYTFGVGKHIELMVGDWFKEMGIFKAHNVKFWNPDFYVSGELDFIVSESPSSDVLLGVECKTSYGDYFKTEVVTGRAGVLPKPKEDHILQVMNYLDSFPKLNDFSLIYIGRDKFDRTEYLIRLIDIDGDKYPEITHAGNGSYIDYHFSLARMYDRYISAMKAVRSGVLPKTDYHPIMSQEEVDQQLKDKLISKAKATRFSKGECLTTDWKCTYCNFRNWCRGMSPDAIPDFKKKFSEGEFKKYDCKA
jgi:hypothetical protein